MRYLLPESIRRLEAGYRTTGNELDRLFLATIRWSRALKNESANDYCVYGLARRTRRIALCLRRFEKVFEKEAAGKKISDKLRFEETVFLNMFFIDVAGALDNLAQVVVLEKAVKLKLTQISFRNTGTIKHMPVGLAKALSKYGKWVEEHLVAFRNPVAHRIPPYIPPYVQTPNGSRSYDSYYIHDFKTSKRMLLHPQVIVDAKTLCEIVRAGVAKPLL